MSNGWDMTTVGDITEVVTKGTTPTSIGFKFVETGINFIKVESISATGTFREIKFAKISNACHDALKRSKLKTGDILFSIAGALGRIAIVTDDILPANTNQALSIIRLKKDSRILPEFLVYALKSGALEDQIEKQRGGVAQQNLSLSQVKNFQVPLPPMSKQKSIVAILDEAFAGIDAAIANTQRNLDNARELFESYLNAVFRHPRDGWAEVQIDSACNSIVDCINKTAPKVDGPTPFKMIRTTNVRDGFVSLDSVKFVTEEVYHSWTRRQVPQRGDIILTREAPLGEVGLLDTDEKVFLGQRLVSYRVNPDVLGSRFLLYAFQSEHVQSQIRSLGSGSTVQHMRVPDSKKLSILLPALEAQQEAVEFLDLIREETERLESINQQKLTSFAELKQSLLQKAFSGELTSDNVVPITAAKKSSASLATDSPAFAAHIMAAAYHWHESQGKNKTFGHVKAQKTLHLVESLAQIDLGRSPIKDAAGPNDFSHMRAAEEWAKDNDFYEFVRRSKGQRGYDFVKGKRFGEWLPQAIDVVEPYRKTLDRVVGLLMPLDTKKAELVATAYAAWNNLLLDGIDPTEEAIIHEARDNWHRDKLQYRKQEFRNAIDQLRRHGMVPKGVGKRVTGQNTLL